MQHPSPPADPLQRLQQWLDDAKAHPDMKEPCAMALATATPEGVPSVRMVLVKDADATGVTFFTNNESQKANELQSNPVAALCFYWMPLGRQLRLTGKVEPVTTEEADAYFKGRRRGSQLGAWASEQSRPLPSREALMARVAEFTEKYKGHEVPRPPHWSGWRLIPESLEFWEEGDYRLHYREIYRRTAQDGWSHTLLNP